MICLKLQNSKMTKQMNLPKNTNMKLDAANTPSDATITNDEKTKETNEKWSQDARIHEYGSAANPDMRPIPVLLHPAELHEKGETRIIPFDISDELDIDDACTSPNLMASFLRIRVGDSINTQACNATSQAFYVIRGFGRTLTRNEDGVEETISWSSGDMFCYPCTRFEMIHSCTSADSHGGAAIYWIHDGPLMDYLGASPNVRKFEPTLYTNSDIISNVEQICHATGDCHQKNRLGVLLGNAKCDQTKTLTHVLWSLLNSIPANSAQRPHRHNSVALDLCVSAKPGVYTLMGKEIDSNGLIVDPIRCDWTTGSVFVTPPGWWHSHHNESEDVAWVLPVQDAGLYTFQRTLDIRFVDDELELFKAGRIRGSAFAITNKAYTEMVNVGATVQTINACDKNLSGHKRVKRVISTEDLLSSKRLK